MEYETLENFVSHHGEEKLYDFLTMLNDGRSYASIGLTFHISASRVCRLANKLFEHKWALSEMTILLLKHRHSVEEWEYREHRQQLAQHSNILPFDVTRDK